MNTPEIQIKSPEECSEKELRDFEQLVCAGGEVSTNGLAGMIEQAEKLLFICEEKMIGVCGIKQPNINYKKNVFKKAGACNLQEKYDVEFGWLYVSPKHRNSGLGSSLIKAAAGAFPGQGCFATTRTTNTIMHTLLEQSGFTRLGKAYKSGNGEYLLSLFGKTAAN
ncbi:MAG: GNAT family N-acetyltransferase [Chitinispirillaceae bacterium]|nr:GNAT family N-acetyltransferase [Chitinispirillaceae bacterium]